jgi:hypothetical protein
LEEQADLYTVPMSASQSHAFSAIAFQLAASLDAYEQDVAAFLGGSFDPDRYRRVSRHMDDMRMYAAALPSLSVAWVEVMIRHFELTHGLWRVEREGTGTVDLQALHAQLREAVQRLSRKCVTLMPSA